MQAGPQRPSKNWYTRGAYMTDSATLGLYGLGTMGSALALNILDNGFALYVSNRSAGTTADFLKEAESDGLAGKLTGADSLVDMVKAMPSPRGMFKTIFIYN